MTAVFIDTHNGNALPSESFEYQNNNVVKRVLPPLKATVKTYKKSKKKKKKGYQESDNSELENSPVSEEVSDQIYPNIHSSYRNSEAEENYQNVNMEEIHNNINPTNSYPMYSNIITAYDNTAVESEDDGNTSIPEKTSETDYRRLALQLASGDDLTTPSRTWEFSDFIFVHNIANTDPLNILQRKNFTEELRKDGIDVIETTVGGLVFTELHASFDRLCIEAELICLHMPLDGLDIAHKAKTGCFSRCMDSFKTENEVDMISATFDSSTKEIFYGSKDKSTFFRSAYRSMLVRHMIANTRFTFEDENSESQIRGLSGLLHCGAYKDAFILHERSELSKTFPLLEGRRFVDSRKDLHNTWLKLFKFQPFWKIRDYFGEKIGLYFAWLGVLVTSLWIPVLLGIAVFVYGFVTQYLDFKERKPSGDVVNVTIVTDWTAKALDNEITPVFALLVCLWGTLFLELWKRKNAELAYKWDVDMFEEQEPNRPQWFGTKKKFNPLTQTYENHYPAWRKVLKTMGSLSVILFMVGLVVTSVIAVLVYKVVSRADWFAGITMGPFMSALTASLLNTISILLLGQLYKGLAYKLTQWENHQTHTQYEDALIMKLFGFQFVNSYASLYYIAFFREGTKSTGVFELGGNYSDDCGETNDCMALLSMQVAVLIICKPMPKLFTDFVLPVLKKYWKKLKCCKRNQVLTSESELPRVSVQDASPYQLYVKSEYSKPPVLDFTLSEYTEKVLQYGYLMLFASAFPLAPLIALITNIIDMRVDARRLLWFNRRPVPQRAEDIGMWFTILSFLNYVGMITNAFIVGMLSSFGRDYKYERVMYNLPSNTTFHDTPFNATVVGTNKAEVSVLTYKNLWIVIIFENIALALKFLLAYLIPDEPKQITQAKNAERARLEGFLKGSGLKTGPGKSLRSDTNTTHRTHVYTN